MTQPWSAGRQPSRGRTCKKFGIHYFSANSFVFLHNCVHQIQLLINKQELILYFLFCCVFWQQIDPTIPLIKKKRYCGNFDGHEVNPQKLDLFVPFCTSCSSSNLDQLGSNCSRTTLLYLQHPLHDKYKRTISEGNNLREWTGIYVVDKFKAMVALLHLLELVQQLLPKSEARGRNHCNFLPRCVLAVLEPVLWIQTDISCWCSGGGGR